MRRLFFGFFVSTLGACVVESPVAKQNGAPTQASAEEQLRASIPGFCADICGRLAVCPDATDPVQCPGQCAGYMSAYLGHGDACVQHGQDFEACFAGIEGCDVAYNPPACDDRAAYEQCAGVDPTYDDSSSGGSGASPGTNGGPVIEAGTGGTAGTVGATDKPSPAYLECDLSEAGTGYPSGPGTNPMPQGNMCELTADNCSDGSAYRLRCDVFNSTLTCNCFKDGLVTGSFTPQTGCPPTYMETDAKCGWSLLYDQ